jgi:hypothetical protein
MPALTSRSRSDDETAQNRPDDHAQRRGEVAPEPAATHARGAAGPATGAGGGGAALVGLTPSAGGATAATAPRVNVVSPSPHGVYPAGMAPLGFEIFGTPNTTVVLYVTVYRRGVVYQNTHATVAIGPTGEGHCSGFTPVDDNEVYGMHARVQDQAGVFSALRVVEYEGQKTIETKGGGV